MDARADEAREQEGGAASAVEPTDEVHERSELARHLRPHDFPATGPTLVRIAAEEHAPESLVSVLRLLPEGRVFENVEAVWEALGGAAEHRR